MVNPPNTKRVLSNIDVRPAGKPMSLVQSEKVEKVKVKASSSGVCVECGKVYTNNKKRYFCSDKCRIKNYNKNRKKGRGFSFNSLRLMLPKSPRKPPSVSKSSKYKTKTFYVEDIDDAYKDLL